MQYIDGNWQQGGGKSFESLNPATGKPVWQGNAATPAQVQQAVDAARAALPAWSELSYEQRLEIMRKFKTIAESRKDELTTIISDETGKTRWDSAGEANGVIGKLALTESAYAERMADKRYPTQPQSTVLRHQPHGVIAVYGPYNFPAHLPNGHIMPSLLAGNTVVFKPSEQSPNAGEWLVRAFEEAGLPKGVLNLVQGERETGVSLADCKIDGLLFTGSSTTGLALHKQFGGRPEVILALEMGGNNPMVVDGISNIDAAVLEVIQSIFITSGQRCSCTRRLIVVDGPWSAPLLEKLVQVASNIKVGAATESPEPYMGPLISNREADRLLAAEKDMIARGGKSLLAMRRLHDSLPFVSPGIVDMTDAKREDEEFFGPLLQVIRVPDFEAAITVANDTRFGLTSALLSDDKSKFELFVQKVRAGCINWNRQTTGSSGQLPFGGTGISGNHRPAGYYAIDACAYPTASLEMASLQLPATLPPGVTI